MSSGEFTAFGIAIVTLGAFLAWERRSPHPMLPLPLFRDRRFSVGASVISLTFFVMFGFFFLITQYLQFVRGYSPFLAGAATLPFAAALVVVSPRSAALAERLGTGRVVSIGFLLVASGFVVLSFISPNSPYAVLALSFILLGCGMGITVAPSTGNIMSAVPQAKAGVGSAVNDTTRELGGALGIAVLGSIVNAGYRGAVHLGDLRLPPPAHAAAAESVGAASEVAGRLPAGGVELLHRSGQAFTDAFNHSSLVSAVWCVLASILIGFVFNRRAENRAEADAVAAGAPATRAEPLITQIRRP